MIRLRHLLLIPLAVLAVLTGDALSTDKDPTAVDGASLLEKHCARCHSIAASGNSPLNKAPPLRELYLKYPIQQLESGFAEGMGSRHLGMPQIQFSSEEVDAILGYLGSTTGLPPSQRQRFDFPDEPIPP